MTTFSKSVVLLWFHIKVGPLTYCWLLLGRRRLLITTWFWFNTQNWENFKNISLPCVSARKTCFRAFNTSQKYFSTPRVYESRFFFPEHVSLSAAALKTVAAAKTSPEVQLLRPHSRPFLPTHHTMSTRQPRLTRAYPSTVPAHHGNMLATEPAPALPAAGER